MSLGYSEVTGGTFMPLHELEVLIGKFCVCREQVCILCSGRLYCWASYEQICSSIFELRIDLPLAAWALTVACFVTDVTLNTSSSRTVAPPNTFKYIVTSAA